MQIKLHPFKSILPVVKVSDVIQSRSKSDDDLGPSLEHCSVDMYGCKP